METLNAIAKVRFSSARPQRVQLYKAGGLLAELLCLEPGQKLSATGGQWTYYVITGQATLTCHGRPADLPTGQFAAVEPDEKHTLAAAGEKRLICLAVGQEKDGRS